MKKLALSMILLLPSIAATQDPVQQARDEFVKQQILGLRNDLQSQITTIKVQLDTIEARQKASDAKLQVALDSLKVQINATVADNVQSSCGSAQSSSSCGSAQSRRGLFGRLRGSSCN